MAGNADIRILVVDDDISMCELLKSILRLEGYQVVGGAHDGEAAIEMCAKLEPDVVCLDIDMPRLSGLESLKAIRTAHPDILIVMVSGESRLDVVREAMRAGADDFIVKPFNAARIFETLHRHAGRRPGKAPAADAPLAA